MYAIERHEGPAAFLERGEQWLLSAEASHNLVLGLAYRAAARDEPVVARPIGFSRWSRSPPARMSFSM